MQEILQASLASLAKDLEFKVEKITPLDFFYTDGLAQGSFLKLVLEDKKSCCSIYLFPSGQYWASGYLSPEQKSQLDSWVDAAKTKKLNSEASQQSIAQNTK